MNNLMIDGITNIDEDLIEKYFKLKKKYSNKKLIRKSHRLIKWGAVVACMCLFLAASVIIIPYIQNEIYENQMKHYNDGAKVENKIGTLTFNDVDAENHICSFTLIKTNDSPIYFKFSGYIVEKEWTDEQGIERKKAQLVDVITPYADYSPDNGHEVLDIDLVITVNGNVVDTIPSEAGEYEITIDYSELYNTLDHVDDVVEVFKFGYFNLMETE